jgi:membrane-bound serine protease (ClpP class)
LIHARLRAARVFLWCSLFGIAAIALAAAQEGAKPQTAQPQAPRDTAVATMLDITGPIGPATSRFIEKGLQTAQDQGSRLVVLQMDTPGGLDTSMRDIIRAILASPTPVITYVAPSGARAASAGTYILYASHIAAMAPATNVGAATPVAIGGESPPSPSPTPTREPQREPQDDSTSRPDKPESGKQPQRTRPPNEPSTAMERKVVNDAVAYLRGLAELRGRNADWAEQAVRTGASLSATAALDMKVIDLIARDLPELLKQIDGREVKVGEKTVKLATTGLAIERIEPDWRTRLLLVLTNPTVAYGLLLIGIYGLLLEGYNPGAIVPGVVGAISLLLALFAFQILSVNYAGLALVGLGIVMIIAEFFFPSFGALGLGGLVAFVVGSIILLDTDVPGLDIAAPVIAAVSTAAGLVLIGMVYVASRSMRRPVVSGSQAMIGATVEAVDDFAEKGLVRYGGELWNARSSSALRAGQPARVVKKEGLLLWVEPL